MKVELSKRGKTPQGVEFLVIKSSEGVLTDAGIPVKVVNEGDFTEDEKQHSKAFPAQITYYFGKRYGIRKELTGFEYSCIILILVSGRGKIEFNNQPLTELTVERIV